MPLDSDVSNADMQLHVEFYEHDRDPHKGKPFVRIVVPGDKTNVIDQPVREDHKRRFPRQWLFFQMKNAEGGTVIGTPLSLWHQDRPQECTDGQLQELLILKFQSVEQVAQASDGQIMRVGMGAVGLRERARSYLSARNAQANGAEMETLKAQVAQLTAMLSGGAAAAPTVARVKRKPGRPAKKKVSVNVQHNDAPASPAGGQ